MPGTADHRRRWLGAIFLAAALVMLIAGQTLLRDRLGRTEFVLFWLACFVFTGLAVLMALLDALALQRHAREQQRKLVEDAIVEIAREKRLKSSKPPGGNGPSR